MVTNNSANAANAQYNLIVGTGSAYTNIAPSATAGIPLVSQGAASNPSYTTAVVAGGGTGATSMNINGVVVSNTTTTGSLSSLTLTDGQVVIGSTGVTPVAATLSAGAGISITNGAGSISIAATGGGTAWVNVTGTTQTLAANTSYLSNNAGTVTFTLPATSTIGDVIRIVGVQGSWTIAQNANQKIVYGNTSSSVGVGGSLTSTNSGDSVSFVASVTGASSVWNVMSGVGNITIV